MSSRRSTLCALSALAVIAVLPAARAEEDCRLMDSKPQANAVIEGRSSEFFVRFDRPVDHIRSTLSILRDGQLVERLQPRLESAPSVLFARAPTLPAGNYQLRWAVRTMTGDKVTQGDIPFAVKD
jgi:methionine-rich copper-binding protein CopC